MIKSKEKEEMMHRGWGKQYEWMLKRNRKISPTLLSTLKFSNSFILRLSKKSHLFWLLLLWNSSFFGKSNFRIVVDLIDLMMWTHLPTADKRSFSSTKYKVIRRFNTKSKACSIEYIWVILEDTTSVTPIVEFKQCSSNSHCWVVDFNRFMDTKKKRL